MKRIVNILLILMSSVVYTAQAENTDVHLKQLVKCINDSDFVCAEEQLPLVEDWSFDVNTDSIWMDAGATKQFVDYLHSSHISSDLMDSLSSFLYDDCYLWTRYYYSIQDFQLSKTYQKLILSIAQKRYGEQSVPYAIAKNSLGVIDYAIRDYEGAEENYLSAYAIYKAISKDKSEDMLTTLKNLGLLYSFNVNFEKSEKYFKEALALSEYLYGVNSPEYAFSLCDMGIICGKNGEEKQGEYYLKQALALRESLYGKEHQLYCATLEELAALYTNTEQYTIAEPLLLEVLELKKNIWGTRHTEYVLTLDNLGVLYFWLGDFSKAESYYLEQLEILASIGENNGTAYANALTNIALLYRTMGALQTALEYSLKAGDIQAKILGQPHIDNRINLKGEYACTLNEISNIYGELYDYDNSRRYLLMCMDILGEKHRDYVACLINLASIEYGEGNEELAIEYTLKAKELYKAQNDGKENALCLRNLSTIYYYRDDYVNAEKYAYQAQEWQRKVLGEDHPDMAEALNLLGKAQAGLKDCQSALTSYSKARDIHKMLFTHSTNFLTEEQRAFYWDRLQAGGIYRLFYPNFVYSCYAFEPAVSTFAYENELFGKGLLLSSANAIKHSILASGDTTLIRQWNELTEKKQQIIALEEKDPQSDYLTQLKEEAESLEKEVTKESAFYRENMRQWAITWDSVRANLKHNQVAIEYMRAPLNDDSTIYCALLLRDTCSYPIMIPLFEEKEVSRLLKISNPTSVNRVYSYHENGQELCRLIWSKVLPYIHPGEIVFFAPTGLLHAVAMESIPYDSTRVISDVYNLVRLSSTRELAIHQPAIPHKTATLYGGISYDVSADELQAQSAAYPSLAFRSVINDTINRGRVGYLPGTKSEIEGIQTALSNKKVRVQTYTSSAANEESFKALSGTRQNILHIATHGFYWADSTNIDPMERSGLLLAGANMTLSGHSDRLPEGVQDGILTAKEISTLDLRETDIVVLSACETAQGVITGEGVFGLQRAFKMAGAKTIMMTLWKVNDEATQLLMNFFYRHYSQGMSKRQAFRLAQQEVRNYTGESSADGENRSALHDKYKNKGKIESHQPSEVSRPYASPYYWAGFILLD